MTKRPAVFLDRDGTLVHPYHYPSRPEHLKLYDNLGPALHEIQKLGYLLVMISNQSGIARGYLTENDVSMLHIHLANELAIWNVRLDAIYYCPHHPEGVVPELTRYCSCRKPQPGMLLQAATDLPIDLACSWFIGDILDDIEAGSRAGCRTILVDIGTESMPNSYLRTPTFVTPTTVHALQIIHAMHAVQGHVDIAYRPQRWYTHMATEPMERETCNT